MASITRSYNNNDNNSKSNSNINWASIICQNINAFSITIDKYNKPTCRDQKKEVPRDFIRCPCLHMEVCKWQSWCSPNKTGVLTPYPITAMVRKGKNWGFFYFFIENSAEPGVPTGISPSFSVSGHQLLCPMKVSEELDDLSGDFQLLIFLLDFFYCSKNCVSMPNHPKHTVVSLKSRQVFLHLSKHLAKCQMEKCTSLSVHLSLPLSLHK